MNIQKINNKIKKTITLTNQTTNTTHITTIKTIHH